MLVPNTFNCLSFKLMLGWNMQITTSIYFYLLLLIFLRHLIILLCELAYFKLICLVSMSSFCCCSFTQSGLTLCNPMDCSMPSFPVLHHLPEFAHTHVHWVSDAIQPPHPLSPPSPPALNLSQHQGLFQWVSSSHQVAKIQEFQLQHQSFQWVFRTDFL